jgi:hypothetical protein
MAVSVLCLKLLICILSLLLIIPEEPFWQMSPSIKLTYMYNCMQSNTQVWTSIIAPYSIVPCARVHHQKFQKSYSHDSRLFTTLQLHLAFYKEYFHKGDWVHLVHRTLSCLLYQPRMIDDGCRAVSRMSGRGNWSMQKKNAPVPLFSQIPHDLTWAQTLTTVVASQQLTT